MKVVKVYYIYSDICKLILTTDHFFVFYRVYSSFKATPPSKSRANPTFSSVGVVLTRSCYGNKNLIFWDSLSTESMATPVVIPYVFADYSQWERKHTYPLRKPHTCTTVFKQGKNKPAREVDSAIRFLEVS